MSESKNKAAKEFKEIVKRTDKENPTREDLKVLKKALRDAPKLWQVVGNMADNAAMHMIEEINATAPMKESLITGWTEMQIELRGENPDPLEKLLVQQVVMSWLRLQLVEHHYTSTMNQSITLPLGRYWEGRLSAAQRRHFRAIETLARVRRLLSKTPAVQVNIAAEGGQQVNVAGDVKPDKNIY